MASYTLDAIRSAADSKYASTDIKLSDEMTVVLVNPMKLSKEKRAALVAINGELTTPEGEEPDPDMDQVEIFQRALSLVAATPAQAKALLDQVGDDLAVLAQIFETYGEAQQAGEASASAA